MDHLSGLDAAFLYLETPEMPMHVGSLHLYELPAGYEGDFVTDVRRHIAQRLHLAPVFRRKLLNMPFELANPVWVLDEDVDIEYHIRNTVLPVPGSREQLDRLVGRLHSSLIDRSRPLWEFYIIEGLQTPADAPAGTRHVGFYAKVHHASLDGASGVVLANAMLDISPMPREVRAARHRRTPSPDTYGIAELAGASLRHSAQQVVKLGRALPTLARTAAQLLRPAPGAAALDGDGGAARARLKAPMQWFGPRTALSANVTNQRVFASVSIPLAEAKRIAKAHGASLNEVVLAICSGALRRHLGEAHDLPDEPLLAAVPVSLREAGNTQMNTQASMMRISLASDVADPLERLRAIHAASAAAKSLTSSVKSVLPTDFPSLGAPWLISGLASLYGRSRLADRLPPLANVTISNVPGSPVPLYLAGARMLTYYPASIVVHGVALNITVESYAGSLDFGLTACRRALPDLAHLAHDMLVAHRELLATVKDDASSPGVAPAAHAPTAKRPARTAAPRKSGTKAAPNAQAKSKVNAKATGAAKPRKLKAGAARRAAAA
ncbi:MAG TPA: wax ester/triacylglycerol synthase family O-acyltransferase [Burkholderiaceae bacterium]|nr:wax ester/triacylglycerol synthase family O-acyltransferase [Burkholderiaceae bacterium]